MKTLLFLLIGLAFSLSIASQQRVNHLLDSLEIVPTTISFHPRGDILISTSWSKEEPQYLLLISQAEGKVKIDTLSSQRPNRSVFSTNGEYLIHNYQDEVSGNFHTAKRKYNAPDDIGPPVLISKELFADNMYYYFMDENQDFYYYTFVRENRSEGGLLYSKFENGYYQKPEMIHPDRDNAVAYSPLLLDEKTMIFAQHGIEDDTYRGVHYSLKDQAGQWSEPKLLSEIPMSDVITFYKQDTVAFLVAKDYRLKFLSKSTIKEMIQKSETL